MGADTGPIRGLCADLASGTAPVEALERSALPAAAREFGAVTFRALEEPLHVRAAVFFHGREDIIPRMFLPLVRELRAGGLSCELLVGYLERHIEADGEHHGPLARRLLDEPCGGTRPGWPRRAGRRRGSRARRASGPTCEPPASRALGGSPPRRPRPVAVAVEPVTIARAAALTSPGPA